MLVAPGDDGASTSLPCWAPNAPLRVVFRGARGRRAGAARRGDADRAAADGGVPGRAAGRTRSSGRGRARADRRAAAAARARPRRRDRRAGAGHPPPAAGVRGRVGRAGGAGRARWRAGHGSPSHHDLLPRGRGPRAGQGRDARRERRGGDVARDRRRDRRRRGTCCTRASTSRRFAAARRSRPGPPRALVLGALVRVEAPRTSRSRSPTRHAGAPGHDRRARRCPATTARSNGGCGARRAERDVRRPGRRRPAGARGRTTCCCTAPTTSPTGWCSSRRSRPGRPVVAPAAGGPAGDRPETPALYPPGDAQAAAAADRTRAGGPRRARDARAAAPRRTSTSATRRAARGGDAHRDRATPSSSSCTARARELDARCCPRSRPRELVVVDTGPDDGGGATAPTTTAPRSSIRRDNPGFGAANNLALARVTRSR